MGMLHRPTHSSRLLFFLLTSSGVAAGLFSFLFTPGRMFTRGLRLNSERLSIAPTPALLPPLLFMFDAISGGDRLLQVRVRQRGESGLRGPLPQQLHERPPRVPLHGRPEREERALPSHRLPQTCRTLWYVRVGPIWN